MDDIYKTPGGIKLLPKNFIIIEFGKDFWVWFQDWIVGQTTGVMPNDEPGYYSWDVERAFRIYKEEGWSRDNKETIEDIFDE